MALPVLDVTARDFDTLVPLLQQRATIKFPNLPSTDFNTSSFVQMFIDLFAGMGDGLNFYIDNVAQELFWDSVRRRESAIRLGALIGFELKSATAASVTLRFAIAQPTPGIVTIPARTKVSTNDPDNPIVFETLIEATIPVGSLFVDIPAENAEAKSETVSSNNQPDQVFTVDEFPFVQDSAQVFAESVEWTEQDDFFVSKSTDKHFVTTVNEDERLEVTFGNGENGAIPVGDIEISYRIGGGVAGNVFTGVITVLETSFQDEFSNDVSMSVANIIPATDGTDKETVAQARFRAPRTVKTNQRTIAREDFEINALEVSGVSRAKVFTSDQDVLISENTGFLFVVPIGGGAPSEALKTEVFLQLTQVKPVPLGFVLNVVGPTYVQIDFTMKVYVTDDTFKTAAGTALRSAFESFFAESILEGDLIGTPNPEMDFGRDFFNSEIVSIAQSAHPEIRNIVLVTDLEAAYDLENDEFPVKGALIFEDGDTGLPLE